MTQGYLHFSADELMEPAEKVERAILEHAGLMEKPGRLDAQLVALMGTISGECCLRYSIRPRIRSRRDAVVIIGAAMLPR